MLKRFIEVVDGLKRQMHGKIDTIVDGYVDKFQTYHKSVDGLLVRAEEQFKRLDADNRASAIQADYKDPLTRDIELMRLKKESALKAEQILTKIKQDVDKERLLPRFNDFTRILHSELPIYDDKAANDLYKQLSRELELNIQAKPGLKQLLVVNDPYQATVRPVGPTTALAQPPTYYDLMLECKQSQNIL